MNRRHDNLITGYENITCSRPLHWRRPFGPRVYPRPLNIRQIVSWWGRIKAAWLVLTLNAVALRWYDDANAHTYGRCWDEKFGGPNRAIVGGDSEAISEEGGEDGCASSATCASGAA